METLYAVDRDSLIRTPPTRVRDAMNTERLERLSRTERDRRARKHQSDHLKDLGVHFNEFQRAHRLKQGQQHRLANNLLQWHANIKREEQRLQEREEKERLKLLKTGNVKQYMEVIQKTKNERLKHLMAQTGQYVRQLASLLEDQRAQAGRILAPGETDAEAAGNDPGSNPAAPLAVEQQILEGEEDVEASLKTGDYYRIAHKIKESVTEQPKMLVGGELKEYQLRGLEWMISLYNNRLNGILADEMGLGKTIQTISLVAYLMEKKRVMGPFLIIVPLSTMSNWIMEFAKWAPDVILVPLKGEQNARKAALRQIQTSPFHALITTYEYIMREKGALSKIKWIYLVMDEGHRIKNKAGKLAATLSMYTTRHRLILTGTPLQVRNFSTPKHGPDFS